MASPYEDEITLWRNYLYCTKCTAFSMDLRYVEGADALNWNCKICGFSRVLDPFRKDDNARVFKLVRDGGIV